MLGSAMLSVTGRVSDDLVLIRIMMMHVLGVHAGHGRDRLADTFRTMRHSARRCPSSCRQCQHHQHHDDRVEVFHPFNIAEEQSARKANPFSF